LIALGLVFDEAAECCVEDLRDRLALVDAPADDAETLVERPPLKRGNARARQRVAIEQGSPVRCRGRYLSAHLLDDLGRRAGENAHVDLAEPSHAIAQERLQLVYPDLG